MERLRFNNSFTYRISLLNEIDTDNLYIPPLLLQPFCENAIWHGLMQKNGEGKLEIDLEQDGDILKCTITDNGIGRQQAEELKTKTAEKQKSLGIKITSDRLSLLNESSGMKSFFRIDDVTDENGDAAGTRVTLHVKSKAVVIEQLT
jgi:sensor histidine kinase YesM